MLNRRSFTHGTLASALLAGAASAADKASEVVLPFHFTAGSIWAPMLVEGKGPYRFLVSTGQTFFVIGDSVAKNLGLRRRQAPGLQTVTHRGPVDLEIYIAREMLLSDVYHMKNVELLGRTYSLEDVYAGIFPFISGMPTSFDFENNRMIFHTGGMTVPAEATTFPFLHAQEPIISSVPVVHAELDGQPLKLIVNTGCVSGLTLCPSAVRRLNLWDSHDRYVKSVSYDPKDGLCEGRTVRARSFKLGDWEFHNPVVELADPSKSLPHDLVYNDGSIGLDLLYRFAFGFDAKKARAWFKPVGDVYSQPFMYNRSGFDMTFDAAGQWVVSALMPGGPADRAGLKLGDKLVSQSSPQRCQQEYALSGAPGSVVEVTIERDGTPRTMSFALEELI